MRHTFSHQLAAWKRAALLKDRTRQAIRDRQRAGESASDLAHDYDVPVDFVRALCNWQLAGDDDHDEQVTQ